MKSMLRSLRWTGSAIVLIAALSGCNSDNTGLGTDTLGPDVASAAATGLFTPPTLTDLQTRLNLTPEQTPKVETLLKDWRADAAAQPRPEGRRGGPNGAKRGDGPGFGDGPGHGGGPGFGGGACLDGETPPHLAFLTGMIGILDAPQIVKLGDYMKAQRAEHRATMKGEGFGPGGGRGRGDHHGFRGRIAEALGISDQQHEVMQATMKTYRDGRRNLRDQFHDGTITAESFRDQAKALRATMESTLRAQLGDALFERLQERRGEMRHGGAERRLGNADRHADRMLDMLAKALKLDDGQRTQVQSILDGGKTQLEAIAGQLKNGNIEPEDAMYEAHRIREDGRKAIEAILTPDQQERFAALRTLLPGMGRGPRG